MPWEPCPGADVRLPADRADFAKVAKGQSDSKKRRLQVREDDLKTFAQTAGCPGCRAAHRVTTATNHAEECRRRTAEELEKVGDERLEKEERLFEYVEEGKSEVKKAKSGESEHKEKPEASASGEAGA